jgi:hypothetical protein
MDKGKLLSSTSWRSRFRNSLGVYVHPKDIHSIFQNFGLTYYEMKKMQNGQPLYGYYESEVNDILNRGEGLKNALQSNGIPWQRGQKVAKTNKKPYIQYTKPKLLAYKYKPLNVADPEDFMHSKKQEYVSKLDIKPEYKNNENDMEKYSDYLIQQYQYESYQPKKVIMTESQFERLLEKKDL